MTRRIARYAVLTPFDRANVVAGVCKLAGFDVEVLPTQTGAVVIRELEAPVYDEWDIRNITGPDDGEVSRAEESGEADSGSAVAAHLSRLSRYGTILFDVLLADGDGFEEGVSGEIKARRFLAGKAGEEISAGLLLNGLDSRIEKFLLGELDEEAQAEIIRGYDIKPADLARMAFGSKEATRGESDTRATAASADDEGQPQQADTASEQVVESPETDTSTDTENEEPA